jgi:hypothetical protein
MSFVISFAKIKTLQECKRTLYLLRIQFRIRSIIKLNTLSLLTFIHYQLYIIANASATKYDEKLAVEDSFADVFKVIKKNKKEKKEK